MSLFLLYRKFLIQHFVWWQKNNIEVKLWKYDEIIMAIKTEWMKQKASICWTFKHLQPEIYYMLAHNIRCYWCGRNKPAEKNVFETKEKKKDLVEQRTCCHEHDDTHENTQSILKLICKKSRKSLNDIFD